MSSTHKPRLQVVAIATGILISLVAVWMDSSTSTMVRATILTGAALASLGLVGLLRSSRRSDDQEVEELRREELEEIATRLDRRERLLAERLVTRHAETEFPEVIDLVDRELDDHSVSELTRRDRRVVRLLESKAAAMFEKIRADEYSEEGEFQPSRVWTDVCALAGDVARIYRPESENPVLDTSVAEITKAASRACLNLLVVLDTLPLDVKEQSLQKIYAYMQRGIKTYETYRTAAPFLEYATHAGRVGRWFLGANPLLLGSSWLAGSLAKRGASNLASKYVRRQGALFLGAMVNVVGFEVAAIYSRGFRYRDANWIYAAELTDLLASSDAGHDELKRALSEVAQLRLRSEYDRVYLFRLLAEGRSARPNRFRASSTLSATEQQAVLDRLSAFAAPSAALGPQSAAWSQWMSKLQERLDATTHERSNSSSSARRSALMSLASWVVDVNGLDASEAPAKLSTSRTLEAMSSVEREAALASLDRDPPVFFAAPDAILSGSIARAYLRDLVDLLLDGDVRWELGDVILEAGAEVGLAGSRVHRWLESACLRALSDRRAPEHSAFGSRISPRTARALLDLLGDRERLVRVYSDAHLVQASAKKSVTVVVTSQRVFAFELRPEPSVVWTATNGCSPAQESTRSRTLRIRSTASGTEETLLEVRDSPRHLRCLVDHLEATGLE